MLKVRVIPTLLWKNVGLVKGVGFDSWRRVGTVLPAIKVYNTRDVDELILLDISATPENRPPDIDGLEEVASDCFVPLTVGGGVRSVENVRDLLLAGADKVCINTALYEDAGLLPNAAGRFGSQCIVAGLDARRLPDGRYECYSHCGTRATGHEAAEWARALEKHGAGEILVTSIERDGSMLGYDIELIQKVASAVRVPVIASGGAGKAEHMEQVLSGTRASAVAAASIFHFTEQTPLEIKHYLKDKGVRVRL